MIEGIIVLNQSEIMTMPIWAGILTGAGIVCCFLFLLLSLVTKAGWRTLVFGLLFLISLGSVVFGGSRDQTEPTGRYRYECTIDKSVSMTEVYEKYEIVEQRGKIWVLEDKESE